MDFHQQDRGQQIRKLFDECLELNEVQQLEFIANANVPSSVKQHVSKLLRITGSEIELTQKVIESVQVSLDVKPLKANLKIGAYQLIKPIGEGGQAEVWLAERSDGEFRHQVAIKFLKPLHDQKDLKRFHSERALLATLKHPNIAQLLDGGELGENRPYMVLEYVEGLPLLEYGLLKKFTLNQYLDCFSQICDAVSYAHSHSIIHRDIKPSNIYVTLDGVVKLLDFGIAQFMSQENMGVQTLPMMTLAYSSPEQVTGKPISTATDVYGLGLLLYEILTGIRAQAVNTSIPTEVIKEITESTPLLPSEVIKTIELSRSYGARDLQGDLDNLVMMAIRKEPNRRYNSVVMMAKDVKNFQRGQSLIAAGDNWSYHVKKFVYRNSIVTLTSLALLVFMVALPIIQYQYQKEINLQKDKVAIAIKEVEQQKAISQKTNDFLVNILMSASLLVRQDDDTFLNEVLESAEKQLTNGPQEKTVVSANLLLQMGRIQKHLGNHEKAVDNYSSALSIFEDTNDLLGKIESLGELAVASCETKDYDTANSYMLQAENISHQLTRPVDVVWHQHRMVNVLNNLGRTEEATIKLTQSIDLLKQHSLADHTLMGLLYEDLSEVSKSNTLALAYLEKSLFHTSMQEGGKNSPSYFARLMNKAALLNEENRKDEAEAVFLEAKAVAEKIYSKDHPKYVNLLNEMGYLIHEAVVDKPLGFNLE